MSSAILICSCERETPRRKAAESDSEFHPVLTISRFRKTIDNQCPSAQTVRHSNCSWVENDISRVCAGWAIRILASHTLQLTTDLAHAPTTLSGGKTFV